MRLAHRRQGQARPGQHAAGPAVQPVRIAVFHRNTAPSCSYGQGQSRGLRDVPAPGLFLNGNTNIVPLINPQLPQVAGLELASTEDVEASIRN